MGKKNKKNKNKEWRNKMEEKGSIPDKEMDPSPAKAGVSSSVQQPQADPNPLPANVNALSFDAKVEALSRMLNDPLQWKGLELPLSRSGLRVSTDLVEEVLKKSYKAGPAAQRFFDWATPQLGNKQSPYAWNLLVDILGNNQMFDQMFEAVKFMRKEGILSRQTFATVFTCYAMAEKANEAIMTFEVMERYGCEQDVAAFNCLLCALCRYKQTSKAQDFARKMFDRFPPDADTYAILLEGWEKEGDVVKSRKTFGEMITRLGWDPSNSAAYNAFLGTLCKGGQVDEALKFLHVMRSRNCFPDKSFYSTAVHALSLQNKADEAAMVFDTMLRLGFLPSTTTYNSMISAYCYAGKINDALRLLDGMVWNGAFPDFVTYNTVFKALIMARKEDEAAFIFKEMTRNEFDPDRDSLTMALNLRDLDLATMVWKHTSRKGIFPDMECISNFLITLYEKGKRDYAKKYVEEMMDKGHKVSEEILKKLKISSSEERPAKKRKDHH